MADFYTGNSSADLFYPTTGGTEPDMREEFNNMMDGKWPEVAKAQPIVLRKLRRDSSDELVPCPCVDILTGEPDLDHFCPVCHGEGYLWDEHLFDGYKVVLRSDVGLASREDLIKPGLLNIPFVIFYMRSSVDITIEDKVVELVLDRAGKPVRPFKRDYLYRIGTDIDLRSDGGKLEYWKLDCYAEERKFLNGLEGVR
jgi:hypothetical protein